MSRAQAYSPVTQTLQLEWDLVSQDLQRLPTKVTAYSPAGRPIRIENVSVQKCTELMLQAAFNLL